MAYEYINLTGVIVPDTATTGLAVEAEYKVFFGENLNVDPRTPQGLLISAETLARDNTVRNNSELANQINPNEAGGVFLDAIGALTASFRNNQTYSYAYIDLTGVVGTPIPAGTKITSTAGFIFESITSTVLDGSGLGTLRFQCTIPGSIAAAANTLIQIVEGPLGLETVNNPDDATLGSLTQSDEAFRLYRKNTLAAQGSSLPEAITSALYATPGVTSLTFRENIEATTQTIDGVSMVAHSIYACVAGGTDLAIATSILSKKSGGCNYNGGVSVDVVEPASGQTYTVKFDRPDLIAVRTRITISSTTSVPDPVATVKAAVLLYTSGNLNGQPGFAVGVSVSPWEISGAINIVAPAVFVKKVEVTYNSVIDYVTDLLPIAIFEQATMLESQIQVITE